MSDLTSELITILNEMAGTSSSVGGGSSLAGGFLNQYLSEERRMPPPLTPQKKQKLMAPMQVDPEIPKNTGVGAENAAESIHAVVTGHKKRGVSMRKKHHVKVSKGFKKLVEEAMKKDEITGFKIDMFDACEGTTVPFNQQAVDNWQWNGSTPYTGGTAGAPAMGWAFSPEYYLDAASVLFNNKTPSANGYAFDTAGTFGVGATATGFPATSPASNLQFTITNSYEDYLFKNITNRVVDMKVYLCAPRQASYLSVAPTTITGGAGAEADALINPKNTWGQALTDQVSLGINLAAANSSVLNMKPQYAKGFMKYFKLETHEVVLEPGETFHYRVQGPSDFEWKWENHVKNNIFTTIAKYSRYVMTVCKFSMDVVGNGVGRGTHQFRFATAQPDTAANSIAIERKLYCSIRMPEQTGFRVPAGGLPALQMVTFGERASRYYVRHWNATPPVFPIGTDLEKQTEVHAGAD